MSEKPKKYGWICDDWDDEHFGVAFDSIEDAFADAQTTFDENAECRNWDDGRHEVIVKVCEAHEFSPFNAYNVVDNIVQAASDDGMEDADGFLCLHTSARTRLESELQEAWGRHVEREHLTPWYTGGRTVETRTLTFEVKRD